MKGNLYNSIHDQEAAKTWAVRELLDAEDADVPARRQVGKISFIPRWIWVIKHRHGMTGTGKFMRIWEYRYTKKCPRFGHHCKTATHGTMCPDASAIEKWKTSLETL
jgi:hypothetical protein